MPVVGGLWTVSRVMTDVMACVGGGAHALKHTPGEYRWPEVPTPTEDDRQTPGRSDSGGTPAVPAVTLARWMAASTLPRPARSRRRPTVARTACGSAPRGSICACVSRADTSVVATRAQTATPRRISTRQVIRSSDHSSRMSRGSGASSMRSASSRTELGVHRGPAGRVRSLDDLQDLARQPRPDRPERRRVRDRDRDRAGRPFATERSHPSISRTCAAPNAPRGSRTSRGRHRLAGWRPSR